MPRKVNVLKTPIRVSLSALGIAAVFAATGCSAPAPTANSTPSATDTPTAAASSTSQPSSTPTPTPTPTPTFNRIESWSDTLVTLTSTTLPKGWEVGSGWSAERVTSSYGLKAGIAYAQRSADGASLTLTSYDRNSQVIGTIGEAAGLSTSGTEPAKVFTSYAGGKPYLIMVQTGQIIPTPGSTAKATFGAVYSVMDGNTGKVIHQHKMFRAATDSEFDLSGDENSVSFYATGANNEGSDYVINPVTGAVDQIKPPENAIWEGRFDGEDLFIFNSGASNSAQAHFGTKKWTIPGSYYVDSAALAHGKYVALRLSNGAETTDPCAAIDIHTGKVAPLSAKIPEGYCFAGFNQPALGGNPMYRGVIPLKTRTGEKSFINEAGVVVSLPANDSFKETFTGADGNVYGTSEAVKGQIIPAMLPMKAGATATALGAVGTASINAVSGDGVAAVVNDSTLAALFIVQPE